MRLVDVLVHAGVVLKAVNPVDQEVVPDHVQHGRDPHPPPAILAHVGVQQTVATNLSNEKGQREDVDEGDGGHGRDNLLADLVLQETGVVLEASVENQVVGEGAEDEVQRGGADGGNDIEGDQLTVDVVARPGRLDWRGGIVDGNGAVAQKRRVLRQKVGPGLIQYEGIENFESDVHDAVFARNSGGRADWQ